MLLQHTLCSCNFDQWEDFITSAWPIRSLMTWLIPRCRVVTSETGLGGESYKLDNIIWVGVKAETEGRSEQGQAPCDWPFNIGVVPDVWVNSFTGDQIFDKTFYDLQNQLSLTGRVCVIRVFICKERHGAETPLSYPQLWVTPVPGDRQRAGPGPDTTGSCLSSPHLSAARNIQVGIQRHKYFNDQLRI